MRAMCVCVCACDVCPLYAGLSGLGYIVNNYYIKFINRRRRRRRRGNGRVPATRYNNNNNNIILYVLYRGQVSWRGSVVCVRVHSAFGILQRCTRAPPGGPYLSTVRGRARACVCVLNRCGIACTGLAFCSFRERPHTHYVYILYALVYTQITLYVYYIRTGLEIYV